MILCERRKVTLGALPPALVRLSRDIHGQKNAGLGISGNKKAAPKDGLFENDLA
ncbi:MULTISPECIES: hypothetical protein [Pseudosulfitobacter]|uniref:hypothetical protein n=1 Tax=Pseudosulfitobacter pseudonitzschiae TaxID=1402135 RepID=UPI000AE15170|nr:hypothetical protein [Pseudosulfitobacter pseudonitzschiae]QKS10205.1 hypothetical protein HT745_17775 [Pseudosulfitobacter pseudonitzschiae]